METKLSNPVWCSKRYDFVLFVACPLPHSEHNARSIKLKKYVLRYTTSVFAFQISQLL